MKPEKITITPFLDREAKKKGEPIRVLFNPNTYSITKTVHWTPTQSKEHNAASLSFGGGGSRTLSLELFYDVTEPSDGSPVNDVRKKTNELVALTRINRDLGRPPAVRVRWGKAPKGSDFPFTGVISSLTQTFTLFSAKGRPLRATLKVDFTEFLNWEKDKKETDPEFTTRLVKRGDTLSAIAAEVYQDPGLWRVIAEANHLDDPRRLAIGLRLGIPKLD